MAHGRGAWGALLFSFPRDDRFFTAKQATCIQFHPRTASRGILSINLPLEGWKGKEGRSWCFYCPIFPLKHSANFACKCEWSKRLRRGFVLLTRDSHGRIDVSIVGRKDRSIRRDDAAHPSDRAGHEREGGWLLLKRSGVYRLDTRDQPFLRPAIYPPSIHPYSSREVLQGFASALFFWNHLMLLFSGFWYGSGVLPPFAPVFDADVSLISPHQLIPNLSNANTQAGQ